MSISRIPHPLLHYWQVATTFLVALTIYLWQLSAAALWIDEAATANEAARSGRSLLSFLADRDAVLGPYYVVMHFWTKLGSGEFWLRLPSVMAMAVAAALVAALARRWWGGVAGLGAGLLFAVLPVTSRYAQEARPYALAIAAAVLAIWLLDRAVTRPARYRWWVGYALAVTVLGTTHLVALCTLLAHPLVVGRRRVRRRWLTWLAVGLVVPAGLLVVALGQRDQLAWISEPSVGEVVRAYGDLAGGSTMFALLAGLAVLGTAGNRHLPMLAAWFVLPPLALAAAGMVVPIFTSRYLLVCTPALVLLAAAGLRRARWWQAVGVATVAAVLSGQQHLEYRQPDGHGPDTRAAAALVARDCTDPPAVREGSATLQTLPYYLQRENCPVQWLGQQQDPAEHDVDRIWLVRPDWAEDATVGGYRRLETEQVSGLRLTLWERLPG